MRKNFLKILYYIAVVGIIWLIVNPPRWLEHPGIYIAFIVFCVLLGFCSLISYIAFAQLSRISKAANIIPILEEKLDEELKNLIDHFVSYGFTLANGPYQNDYELPTVIIPFVHGKHRTYAWIVSRENALRIKTVYFGFDSLLKNDRASLGTIQNPLGVSLPQNPDDLRQVFVGASVETLFKYHLKAIAYLKNKGIETRVVTTDTYIEDRKRGLENLYHRFKSSILKNTLVLLWRSISKKTPYNGALENQKIAQEQIARLQQYYSA